jgi:hypothetical protein
MIHAPGRVGIGGSGLGGFSSLFLLASVAFSTLGCGEAPFSELDDSSGAPDESSVLEQADDGLVSGAKLVSLGDATSESEAVIAISYEPSGQAHTMVSVNADDPAHVSVDDGGTPNVKDDDTRTITQWASQMMIFHRTGLAGGYTATRIPSPDGSALWGDPAIAATGRYAVATTLRIPPGKFPRVGDLRFPISMSPGSAKQITDYLSGACVARSSDYGQTWAMPATDCILSEGHFYDGGAAAVDAQGAMYVAFNDATAFQIDVWRTTGPQGAFSLMPDPFPGKRMDTHPRMRLHGGVLYVMSIDTGGQLWLNRYTGGAWQTPTLAATGASYHNSIDLANGPVIRLGPGHDFTVHSSPFNGTPQLVFVHSTVAGAGKSMLKTGACSASGGVWSCQMIANATSNPDVHCFNPSIATGWYSPAPGVSVPSTKITYQRVLSTETKVALHVSPANFSTTAVRVSGWQVPCPDLRGYWGDYDSMAPGSDGSFHRVFSDSTGSACSAQAYASSPLGVSESIVPIAP